MAGDGYHAVTPPVDAMRTNSPLESEIDLRRPSESGHGL
jgi:hypothetical protein